MEYGWYISEYPTWEFIRPKEFRQRYIEGTLDKFDAIFTYSSVEHSGLGKKCDTTYPALQDIFSIVLHSKDKLW